MTKAVTTLLILFAFATAGASAVLAEGGGAKDGRVFHGRGDTGGHGRGFHGNRPPVITGGFVGIYGYGSDGGYGYDGGYGNGGDGYGDWYGISSGHTECPLFRKRVPTPEGWQVQMVPVC